MLPLVLESFLPVRWPLTLAAFIIILALFLPRSSVRISDLWREILIVVSAYFCYFLVRGIVEGRENEAIERAIDLISLEQRLGIFWELDLQLHADKVHWLMEFANWVYVWGHWPVIIVVAAWLFLQHREAYALYRNAFLISGAIGLVIFGLLPLAPPRFLPEYGFIDTAEAYHLGRHASMLVNQYAAMPSLHFGWNLLVGIAVFRHATAKPVKAAGLLTPLAMWFGVVVTGNHFVLDTVAGAIVALMGLGGAVALRATLRAEALSDHPLAYVTRGLV